MSPQQIELDNVIKNPSILLNKFHLFYPKDGYQPNFSIFYFYKIDNKKFYYHVKNCFSDGRKDVYYFDYGIISQLKNWFIIHKNTKELLF